MTLASAAADTSSNATAAVTAWIALGISAATFVWKFVETYIRWPRLGVALRQTVFVSVNLGVTASIGPPPQQRAADTPSEPESGSQDRFDIVVVNSGAEATTVSNVGIRSADRSLRIDVERERENGQLIDGPGLPARVEEHGSLHLDYSARTHEPFSEGNKARRLRASLPEIPQIPEIAPQHDPPVRNTDRIREELIRHPCPRGAPQPAPTPRSTQKR